MRQENGHSIDLVFVLLIFAAFVSAAVMLISMGTGEYRKIIGRMQDNDLSRITAAYLAQKVRQGRAENAVSVRDFHGIPSLCIRTETNGREYETFLYVHEGYLTELMTPVACEDDVIPAGGMPVVPVEELSFREVRENAVLAEGVTGDGKGFRTLLTISP